MDSTNPSNLQRKCTDTYEGKWEAGDFGKMKEIVFSGTDQC